MNTRDRIAKLVESRLHAEGVAFERDGSELVETTTVNGSVMTEAGERSVTVIVTRFPARQNPGTYQGREVWTVDILDAATGEPLLRTQNPVDSLDDAFSMIDWHRVRGALQIAD